MGVPAFKVSSGELTNLPFMDHIGRKGKPVIVSTGMATLDEVHAALDTMVHAGCLEPYSPALCELLPCAGICEFTSHGDDGEGNSSARSGIRIIPSESKLHWRPWRWAQTLLKSISRVIGSRLGRIIAPRSNRTYSRPW